MPTINNQQQIQSMEKMTHQSHEMSPGPSDKVKGKQARWTDCEIPGIPPEELDINRQEHLLKEIKSNQATENISQNINSGYDWLSNRSEGNDMFSRHRQQKELNEIAAGKYEDADKQQAILTSFEKDSHGHSTLKM